MRRTYRLTIDSQTRRQVEIYICTYIHNDRNIERHFTVTYRFIQERHEDIHTDRQIESLQGDRPTDIHTDIHAKQT